MLCTAAAVSLVLSFYPAGPVSKGWGEENHATSRQSDGKVKILLLATPPDHPYGTHMYRRECELLAKCLQQHPGVETVVCEGWTDFGLTDEIYLNPELMPATRTVAKVRVPNAGQTTPHDQTVAWIYERPESSGGRSFACSLGHFHGLFGLESFRRLMVNGILRTSGVEVPAGGAACRLDANDLELPPDPKIGAASRER
jgi:hypothetical protein